MAAGDDGPKGQVQFIHKTNPQYNFWTVPDNVYEIHAVVVGGGVTPINYVQYSSGIQRYVNGNYQTLLHSYSDLSNDVGGGNGGASGGGGGSAGGGGAAGYLGDGGKGAFGQSTTATSAAPGSGGGGGGGGGEFPDDPIKQTTGNGGGVGLKGIGATGAGGGYGQHGQNGSIPPGDIAVGGGTRGFSRQYSRFATGGAALRYTKTPIPVTPGEQLRIYLWLSMQFHEAEVPFSGVRIMWGGGRSFPYNAGDV